MKKWWLSLGVILFIMVVSLLIFIQPIYSSKVFRGVVVEGVDVGGNNREEVMQLLRVWQKKQRNKHITLYYGDKTFGLDGQEIDLDVDVEAMLEEIWGIGRKGSPWDRIKNMHTAVQTGYRVPLRIKYNVNKLDEVIEEWKNQVERPPLNATLSLTTGTIVPGQHGRKLEVGTLRPLLCQALRQPGIDSVPLPVTMLDPSITVSDISRTGIKNSVGVYSTYFTQDNNRSQNIKLAARKLNGHIVYPKQVFSFNETVGPRDKTSGFKEAMELIEGQLVPGIGGGVCQVSSTLYNAVLLADLAVTERHNHSKPLEYVPLGRDATVVFGALDFKFTNNTDSPVMIITEVVENKLTVGIFGRRKESESVEILSTDKVIIPPAVIKKTDNELLLGETKIEKQGKPGYEITTLRVVKAQGREIRRELLSTDRYLPDNTLVKVGSQIPSFAQ